jgi:hypothetical protein
MSSSIKLLRMQSLAVLFVSAAMCAPSAFAQANNDPPPVGAILDLSGQPVNHGAAVSESVGFTAALASTDITFAFREDPAFISFSDVSLLDTTTGSATNLILNGNFASGSGQNATDWTYVNIFGAAAGGVVSNDCGGGLATCWFDGAVQAYDAIDQFVATIVGDNYLLSFLYSDDGGLTTFSALSTNGDTTDTGGNGIDILAYGQAGLPSAGGVTPEPDSIWLLSTGALMLGAAFYYKRRNAVGDIRF